MNRGEIWLVKMRPSFGHEIRKTRPAILVQNDVGLENSRTVLVVPLTSRNVGNIYPFDVYIGPNSGIPKSSKALCEQLKCVDKRRLLKRMGRISFSAGRQLNDVLKLTMGLY